MHMMIMKNTMGRIQDLKTKVAHDEKNMIEIVTKLNE